jgi:beta-glucanase (GH16 family)
MWTGNTNGVDYSEIDIFEINGHTGQYTNNAHYRLHNADTLSTDAYSAGNILDTNWHTAGCLWTSNEISYFLDGNYLRSIYNYEQKLRTDSLQAMPIIIDINSPAGNFCETFDPVNSVFPYRYQVDYVKVWQIADSCSTNLSYCSNFNPATFNSKIYQSITMEGGSCTDAINNNSFLGLYGSNYVLMDAGFSIDNNSKVEIDVERCLNSSGIHYIGAPAP